MCLQYLTITYVIKMDTKKKADYALQSEAAFILVHRVSTIARRTQETPSGELKKAISVSAVIWGSSSLMNNRSVWY